MDKKETVQEPNTNPIPVQSVEPLPIEPPKQEVKKVAVSSGKTPIEQGKFPKNGGGIIAYDTINRHCNSSPNCVKLRQAFTAKHGDRIGKKAMVSLFYENGTFLSTTVGVCNRKYQINGDYRNCNFADMNSAGMDAGLKQINTFYQRKRIAKLGGPDCNPKSSRDRSDPCTASQVNWLLDINNNIKIALDIYSEQGFQPWVGAKRAKVNNYS